MTLKWKIFGVFNYLFLLWFGFLLFKAMQFLNTEYISQTDTFSYTLLFLGILVIFLNIILNIYILHRHFPDKPLSARLKNINRISLILFIIAIAILLINIFPEIHSNDEYEKYERSYDVFTLTIFLSSLIIGGYIVFCQLSIKKYIEERNQLTINEIIDGIGSDK